MSFTKKILIEHSIKYGLTFIIAASLWNYIEHGLLLAAASDKLDAIAVIMGIISLCSMSGYFAFSYTTVGKQLRERFFGYLCTFFLGIALILSLIIIYFIAVIWVPEMKLIWGLILLSLYIGTYIFDNLDLLRMGLDVAATNFFEKGYSEKSKDNFSTVIQFLKEGQRLEFSNALIGKAMIELGQEKENLQLQEAGRWILDNSNKSQHKIDKRIAQAFSVYSKKDEKIRKIIEDLQKGQTQNIADSLIANLLDLAKEK